MESIETWHAERIDRPIVRGAWRTLRKRLPLVDPRQLPRERDLRADAVAVGTCVPDHRDFAPGEPLEQLAETRR